MVKKFSLLSLLLITVVGLYGCAPAATAAPTATVLPEPVVTETAAPEALAELPVLPEGALFQVVRPDGSVAVFTLDDLKKFPLMQLFAEGKMEEGPALADVLQAAGITEYTSVHLEGSSNTADLTREQVEAGAILDFNNHGTVKLSSNDIPKSDWTKDVSLIEVH